MNNTDIVKYIIGDDNNTQYNKLLSQFNDTIDNYQGLSSVNFGSISKFEKPKNVIPSVRFNYSLDELNEICNKYLDGSEKAFNTVLYLALSLCGVKISDEDSLLYVKSFIGYKEGRRFFRVSGTIGSKRLTMRIVPSAWGEGDDSTSTRFALRNTTDVYLDDINVGQITSLFTASSLKNLAYVTKHASGEYNLNLNPYQFCNQNCLFCSKGFRHMNDELRKSLVNLSPDQIIRYIEMKLPELNFATLTEVIILTGRYYSTEDLLKYVERIVKGLNILSKGDFDPLLNHNQRVKISTHLLQSEDDMIRGKELGIKRFIYPIEIFNDGLRKKYMTNDTYSENKGDTPISSVFEVLERAVKIFGADNVEPVIIVGLDSYEETINGLKRIKQLGVNMLTYSVFRVYDCDQFEMYKLSLDEIVSIISIIENTFSNGYKQIIDFDDKQINKLYRKL